MIRIREEMLELCWMVLPTSVVELRKSSRWTTLEVPKALRLQRHVLHRGPQTAVGEIPRPQWIKHWPTLSPYRFPTTINLMFIFLLDLMLLLKKIKCTPESTKSDITANKSSKKLTLIRCANLNTKWTAQKCQKHLQCSILFL